MDTPFSAMAPGEHDYAGETQGATQQASQNFYLSDVHPVDRPFFGCLQPCNSTIRRVDFLKTNPIITIGRGLNNDIQLEGMRISYNHCQITWDGRDDCHSMVVVLDNSTNGTWINGVRVAKGQSRILRDGNEIAFGSPMQQQNPLEDYRFIYRHLAPVELTGIHALYDMAHELGRGTFATVMKAMARDTGEWWAVKIIHAQKLRANNNEQGGEQNNQSNSNQLASLAREVGILETLDHPNICRLRETFVPEQGGHDFYLVLEYVEGGDLLDYILSHNGLSEPMAQHITHQMCSALSYVHSKDITHRDLKPENVLLTTDDPPVVKVADFGLAKAVDSLTMLRTMCGTPNYLAPEVVMEGARGRGYDHLVDSWSVGVIVFSMLTNTGPFIEDENETNIRRRIAERKISWSMLHELRVSPAARDFIRCLLEVDPTKRMSLTDALRHPWLDSSATGASGSGTAHSPTMTGNSLSDVSELSVIPEDDHNISANGDASMLSAAPSSDDMPGVGLLDISSPAKAGTRRPLPLERRSNVLAREAEAEAHAAPKEAAEAEAEPVASGSTPPSVNRNSGNAGKRRRPESPGGGSSPVDVAMGGGRESADSDDAAMEVEPHPPAAKRGRRSPAQGREQQNAALPPTERNGGGNGSGRVLRPRAAAPASGSRR